MASILELLLEESRRPGYKPDICPNEGTILPPDDRASSFWWTDRAPLSRAIESVRGEGFFDQLARSLS
ncbi:MAG: hypothetical protein WC654_06325 [Patescibacteria group bacterium]